MYARWHGAEQAREESPHFSVQFDPPYRESSSLPGLALDWQYRQHQAHTSFRNDSYTANTVGVSLAKTVPRSIRRRAWYDRPPNFVCLTSSRSRLAFSTSGVL
ncbi:hypothetical protein PYCC9005_001617 [Savitreella phatthalungensis]